MHRRDFLRCSAGTLAAAAWPVRRALAAGEGTRRFVFVVNYGGWDPTRVYATEFDNLNVDMERAAERGAVGGISFVDHAQRPAVRAFFEQWHARTLVLNGVLVPSVAHENCIRLALTGTTRQDASDWGAIIAGVGGDGFALPGVVAAAPSFPGAYGSAVTRTGTSGQLAALLDGSIVDWSDVPTRAPSSHAEARMDDYLRRRAAAFADVAAGGREGELAAAYEAALGRAGTLKGLADDVDWSTTSSFAEQIAFATDVLSKGVTRSVTLGFTYYSWDTHAYNDAYQSTNFEQLFSGLRALMDALAARPGSSGGTLADETVVVVLSEMGRTPQLNASDGKDHWPYTSLMVVGPGVTGDRVVGGFDAYYYGRPLDPATAEIDEEHGAALSADVVGATLLRVAGVDPEAHLPGVDALEGVLA